ncbi:hypothetical protein ABK046_52950, partial [Streptomyces caeruleatus]
RIISFDSIATPVEPKDEVATTTHVDDIVIATTTDVGTSTLTEDVIDSSTGSSAGLDTTSVTPVATSNENESTTTVST